MGKKSRSRNQIDLIAKVEELGACNERSLQKLLRGLKGKDDERLSFATGCLLSSRRQGSNALPDWWNDAFEILGESQNPVALAFLKTAALKAEIAEVRLNALEQLQGKPLDDETIDALHEYVMKGLPDDVRVSAIGKFSQPDEESYRRISLKVLSHKESRNELTTDVVWNALIREIERDAQADDAVYQATLDCLASMADASLVKKVLTKVKETDHPELCLDLLSVAGQAPTKELKGVRNELRSHLVSGLKRCRDTHDVRPGLKKLAKKLKTKGFLGELAEEFGERTSQTPGTEVLATTIESYNRPDITVCNAALKFGKASGELSSNSACYKALRRCTPNHGKRILAEILRDKESALSPLKTKSRLTDLFGAPEELLSIGVQAIEEGLLDPPYGEKLCMVVIAAGLPDIEGRAGSKLRHFERNMCTHHSAWTGNLRKEYIEICGEHNLWEAWSPIVRIVMEPDGPPERHLILKSVLAEEQDELSKRLVSRLLKVGAQFQRERSDYPQTDTSAREIETCLKTHQREALQRSVREHLASKEGMSPYVLGLARRLELDFCRQAGKLLNSTVDAQEKNKVVAELGRLRTKESAELLAEATRDPSAEVRKAALKALASVCEYQETDSVELTESLVNCLVDRFSESPEVQKEAYRACQRIAPREAISKLVERASHVQDPQTKGLITGALKAIGERLAQERPVDSKHEEICAWLKDVGKLQDESFFEQVAKYIYPDPHPNRAVVLQAFECLGRIGAKEGINLCREYIEEFSPEPDLRRAAQRTKAKLHGRQDIALLDELEWLVGKESEFCDPEEYDYEDFFGAQRCGTIASQLGRTKELWDYGTWDPIVACLDGIAHCVVKQIYLSKYKHMGLSRDEAAKSARRKKYQQLLERPAFKDNYNRAYARFFYLHELRKLTETTHLEEKDGTPKPGIQDRETAEHAKEALKRGFQLAVEALK